MQHVVKRVCETGCVWQPVVSCKRSINEHSAGAGRRCLRSCVQYALLLVVIMTVEVAAAVLVVIYRHQVRLRLRVHSLIVDNVITNQHAGVAHQRDRPPRPRPWLEARVRFSQSRRKSSDVVGHPIHVRLKTLYMVHNPAVISLYKKHKLLGVPYSPIYVMVLWQPLLPSTISVVH